MTTSGQGEAEEVVGGTGAGGGSPAGNIVVALSNEATPGVHGKAGVGSSKRVRSDAAEWSESAITGLLDAFGARYIASHRGNLRGKDWADVTRAVNASGITGTKSVEQCRNKIDNLKKRFKLEREKGTLSAWPWFRTLDAIVGRAPKRAGIHGIIDGGHLSDPDLKVSLPGLDLPRPARQLDQLVSPPRSVGEGQEDSDPEYVAETLYSSQRDSHTDFRAFKGLGKDVMSEMTANEEVNAVSNGPGKPNRKKRKNLCQAGKDVAASISNFAGVFAKIEFAKMELFKDVELRRLEMQYKLAKLAHNRKQGRTNSVSSGSD